ncbi:hypothetical protein MA16_Dca020743 [Dendrobium catenatum]|uniref:Methyltransferase domain-containing protein n=1 Tax=Dendrobium catenatum TaxID=906689 RepID=A0A2I0X7J4_9ASPA|nr:hypothetical protein MA16_Dca020743 [Dendrobium catenatum]
MAATRRYSCKTAAETLDWINAIADFLLRFRSLIDAHVVNFFKDRLWETIDNQWMECLRKESVENLLGIPSALEHWPSSLREFVATLRSLVLPREQNLSNAILENFHAVPLGSVLSQGMNSKKKHEVEILAAAVSTVARGVNAQKIIDVGSGQGYLSQVLSFEYQLSVVAIDSSLHHSSVTSARANRIKKHYAAKLPGDELLKVPQTVTCQVLSSESLAALSIRTVGKNGNIGYLVLAGLHACGDLSVNMLRAFVDCEQVKALINVGCCYNLVSEESSEKTSMISGFPLSNGAKLSGLTLGKNARDLACQSAERWKSLTKKAALQNFELHAFRATFQMMQEFIGPYWSLRASLGPLIETYILLDRLLFLQEHGNFAEVQLVPLFDPTLSPRNVAIVARKIDANIANT